MVQTFATQLRSRHDDLPFDVDIHYLADARPKPVIIFIHGFNSFKDWGQWSLLADELARRGFVFVRFNLSHNGTSPDSPTQIVNFEAYAHDFFSTDLDDIASVIEYLHHDTMPLKSEMNLQHLITLGHSRGGALAILAAYEEARVFAAATWCSIISTRHFWTPEHIEIVMREGKIAVYNSQLKRDLYLSKAYYEDNLLYPTRLDVKTAVQQMAKPLFHLHGANDTYIPPAFLHKLGEWQPASTRVLLPHANHTLGGRHPFTDDDLPTHTLAAVEATCVWLKTILP